MGRPPTPESPAPDAWPATGEALARRQAALAGAAPAPWRPDALPALVGGCFVCFPRRRPGPGAAGDPAWAAAVVLRGGVVVDAGVVAGAAEAPYVPGLLGLRAGRLLERAVRALRVRPDVVMVNASGRDHPRGAGLALQLGAVLDIPTVGVTHRPLLATGPPPTATQRGAMSPVTIDGTVVGMWVRTRRGVRPVLAHAAWRTHPQTAAWLVLATAVRARTPAPIRESRRIARTARTRGTTA